MESRENIEQEESMRSGQVFGKIKTFYDRE